jgi:hypothetical protein
METTMNADVPGRRRRARSLLLALLTGSTLLAAPAHAAERLWCDPGCGTLVTDWSRAAYAVIRADNGYANPMAATRVLAMMHLAMHDAVNAAQPRYATSLRVPGNAEADPAVAAVTAAHDVLRGLYPAHEKLIAAERDKAMIDAGVGPRIEAGKTLGAAVAAAILADRKSDGADASEPYAEKAVPGRYRFVPGTKQIAAPHWRKIRPFVLAAPDQFRTAAPPALGSTAYAVAYNEVKATGGAVSAERKPDETAYAAFWYEFSDIGWNRVARVAARQRNLDLWDSARLFALVNVAMADSYIAGWDSKLAHDSWRPVTAIRLAADDGNGATAPDANWTSMLPTPPIQDHPSTHATLGAAAAVVLADVVGDALAFTMTSTSARPDSPARSFPGFAMAAKENAESRIKAGLHFRFATDAGLELGRRIGTQAAQSLRPLVN